MRLEEFGMLDGMEGWLSVRFDSDFQGRTLLMHETHAPAPSFAAMFWTDDGQKL